MYYLLCVSTISAQFFKLSCSDRIVFVFDLGQLSIYIYWVYWASNSISCDFNMLINIIYFYRGPPIHIFVCWCIVPRYLYWQRSLCKRGAAPDWATRSLSSTVHAGARGCWIFECTWLISLRVVIDVKRFHLCYVCRLAAIHSHFLYYSIV